MIVTKVNIISENGESSPAIYLHDDSRRIHLFVDKDFNIKTHVKNYIFESETPILTI